MNPVVAAVLRAAPVIDGHNDLPMQLRALRGSAVAGLDTVQPDFHTDLPRLRAGGVGAQFWSVYVPSDLPEPAAVAATMEQIDAVYRLVAAYPDDLAVAYSAEDVRRAWAAGRIASLIGIEGGHSLATSLGVLRAFARLGVRYVTLTHNNNTSWADSAVEEPAAGGLTDVGRAIVREMQRIGVLVDLSHVAPVTMHAALTLPPPLDFPFVLPGGDRQPPNVRRLLTRFRDNGGVVRHFVPYSSREVYSWSLSATRRPPASDCAAAGGAPSAPCPAAPPHRGRGGARPGDGRGWTRTRAGGHARAGGRAT